MVQGEKSLIPEQVRAGVGRPSPAEEIGQAVRGGAGLDELIDTLLEALTRIGGFDSAFITAVDRDRGELVVRQGYNRDSAQVPVGMSVDLPGDYPERAYLGITRSGAGVPADPDSRIARALGLATYASVPIITPDYRLFGMLCGAGRAHRQVSDDTVAVMEFFSRLIVDQMVRDDTRRAEERARLAETALRERAMFLAEAEHMLKTPLAVIDGYVDGLRRGEIPEGERAAVLEIIARNTTELGAQVGRLLEEVRAEVSARDLHPATKDLAAELALLVNTFNGAARGRDVRLAAGDQPIWVEVDPVVLDQVLAHLLDNAVKYSTPGTPIEVSLQLASPWAQIVVRDHGVGLPPGVDVFAAFQRGDTAQVADRPGIGLGLHIVRNLLTAMGGQVSARPNPGHGADFTVLLPLAGAGSSRSA
jgi:signal transduction histidine kinase